MVRVEAKHRLYGAVSEKERLEKLGQYYVIRWSNPKPKNPLKLVIEYQRAATARKVYTQEHTLSAARKGTHEFKITGADLKKTGRVLAWRVTLLQDDEMIASKQSYLW